MATIRNQSGYFVSFFNLLIVRQARVNSEGLNQFLFRTRSTSQEILRPGTQLQQQFSEYLIPRPSHIMMTIGNMGENIDPSITPAGGDDNASQSSQRSSGGSSLLQRIQMQRHREATVSVPTTPQQIQVPNYGPIQPPGHIATMSSASPFVEVTETNFFSKTWSDISQSMEAGMAGSSVSQLDGMQDALLPPSAAMATDANYSMSNYFLTFARDVYGLFMRLHVVGRVVVVVGLLYAVVKLL